MRGRARNMTSHSGLTQSPLGQNPIPVSARQETQIRELFYKRVRNQCASEIKDFAACAHGRTFTSGIACRQQRITMNRCMIAFDTQEQRDAAREEWFATFDRRLAEKEEKERQQKEAVAFRRRYYGLDKSDNDDNPSKLK